MGHLFSRAFKRLTLFGDSSNGSSDARRSSSDAQKSSDDQGSGPGAWREGARPASRSERIPVGQSIDSADYRPFVAGAGAPAAPAPAGAGSATRAPPPPGTTGDNKRPPKGPATGDRPQTAPVTAAAAAASTANSENTPAVEEAVIKIQALVRGHLTRKALKDAHQYANSVPNALGQSQFSEDSLLKSQPVGVFASPLSMNSVPASQGRGHNSGASSPGAGQTSLEAIAEESNGSRRNSPSAVAASAPHTPTTTVPAETEASTATATEAAIATTAETAEETAAEPATETATEAASATASALTPASAPATATEAEAEAGPGAGAATETATSASRPTPSKLVMPAEGGPAPGGEPLSASAGRQAADCDGAAAAARRGLRSPAASSEVNASIDLDTTELGPPASASIDILDHLNARPNDRMATVLHHVAPGGPPKAPAIDEPSQATGPLEPANGNGNNNTNANTNNSGQPMPRRHLSSPDWPATFESEEAAAIRIQSAFRGYRTRKNSPYRSRSPAAPGVGNGGGNGGGGGGGGGGGAGNDGASGTGSAPGGALQNGHAPPERDVAAAAAAAAAAADCCELASGEARADQVHADQIGRPAAERRASRQRQRGSMGSSWSAEHDDESRRQGESLDVASEGATAGSGGGIDDGELASQATIRGTPGAALASLGSSAAADSEPTTTSGGGPGPGPGLGPSTGPGFGAALVDTQRDSTDAESASLATDQRQVEETAAAARAAWQGADPGAAGELELEHELELEARKLVEELEREELAGASLGRLERAPELGHGHDEDDQLGELDEAIQQAIELESDDIERRDPSGRASEERSRSPALDGLTGAGPLFGQPAAVADNDAEAGRESPPPQRAPQPASSSSTPSTNAADDSSEADGESSGADDEAGQPRHLQPAQQRGPAGPGAAGAKRRRNRNKRKTKK